MLQLYRAEKNGGRRGRARFSLNEHVREWIGSGEMLSQFPAREGRLMGVIGASCIPRIV
jgi:hypothetical protein